MATSTRRIGFTAARSTDAVGPRLPDRVVAVYAVVSGAALAFPGRPALWPLLAVAHVLVVLVAVRAPPLRLLLDAVSRRAPRASAFLARWYPLLIMPLAYRELQTLNVAVWGGTYFDGAVMAWEQALFGGQPSLSLAQRLPSLLLSEVLHLAYLSYYAIIYAPFLALELTGRHQAFRTMLLAVVLGFAVHYLAFIYFPVQGPRYLFPAPGGALTAGPFYQLAHLVLEAGSSRGAAFPSSHGAIAVIQTIMTVRLIGTRPGVVVGVTTALLCFGAVYGGFHYGVDMIAGVVVGVVVALMALRRVPADR